MSKHSTLPIVRYLTYAYIPISLLYLLIGYNQGINVYDEGVAMYGAHTVLHGGLVYKDFWTGYGPAQFYLLALIFRIFGESMIVGRITTIVLTWAMCFTVYLAARRLVSPALALLAWFLVVTASIGIVPGYPGPMPAILMFTMLGSLCLLNYVSSRQTRWLMLSGLIVGVVTLFRHDFGAYNAFAGTLVLATFAMASKAPEAKSALQRMLSLVRMLGCYYLATAVLVVPIVAYLVAKAGAPSLVHPLIILPLSLYAKYFGLPYPMPPNPMLVLNGACSVKHFVRLIVEVMPYWMPQIIYAIAAVMLVVRCWKDRSASRLINYLPVMLFILLGIEAFNYARIRAGYSHTLPTLIISCLVLAALLKEIPKRKASGMLLRILVVIACVSLFQYPVRGKVGMARAMMAPPEFVLQVPRGKGLHLDAKWARYQDAVRFVQARVGKDEKIFVGNTRHDTINVNDALFYFLSERESATKYSELHRAVASQSACQSEIVHDIRAHDVKCIVLRADTARPEPNASSVSSGVHILDDYILDRFVPIARFGDHTVWTRKDIPG